MASESRVLLARAIKALSQKQSTVMRKGEIKTVNGDGTVDVTISGDPMPAPSVPTDSNYIPQVGDQVNVAVTDGVPAVTGMDGDTPTALRNLGLTYATASIATSVARAATTYGDLSGSVGPAVTINVGPSGFLLVGITCEISTTSTNDGGRVGVDLSSPNSTAASDDKSLAFKPLVSGALSRATASIPFTGCTPGATTCTLKYKDIADSGSDVNYANRTIWALTF